MEVVWLERVENARSHCQQVQSQVFQTTHNFRHRFTVARVSFSRCHTCLSLITRVKANLWETLVPFSRIQPWSLPLCFLLGFLEWKRCDRGTLWTEPFCVSSICLCWRQVTPEGWAVNHSSWDGPFKCVLICTLFICIFDHIDAQLMNYCFLSLECLLCQHCRRFVTHSDTLYSLLSQSQFRQQDFHFSPKKRAVTLELFALSCAKTAEGQRGAEQPASCAQRQGEREGSQTLGLPWWPRKASPPVPSTRSGVTGIWLVGGGAWQRLLWLLACD